MVNILFNFFINEKTSDIYIHNIPQTWAIMNADNNLLINDKLVNML